MPSSSPNPTFDIAFSNLDDFNLSDCVSCAVEERYGYDILMNFPEAVPLAHRIVHYVWSTSGYMMGEGYAMFFNLSCNHAAFATCLDTIQLPQLAKDIREATKLIPVSKLGDYDAISDHFGEWEDLENLLDKEEARFFASEAQINTAHASYIHSHKESFRDLYSDMKTQHSFIEMFGSSDEQSG